MRALGSGGAAGLGMTPAGPSCSRGTHALQPLPYTPSTGHFFIKVAEIVLSQIVFLKIQVSLGKVTIQLIQIHIQLYRSDSFWRYIFLEGEGQRARDHPPPPPQVRPGLSVTLTLFFTLYTCINSCFLKNFLNFFY